MPDRPRFADLLARLRPERSGLVVSLAVGLVLLALLALGFAPFVRTLAAHRAARSGATLTVQGVRPGLGSVWLRGVAVEFEKIPSLHIRIDALQVTPRPFGGIARVQAYGARLELEGSVAELERQYADFRSARDQSAQGAGSSSAELELHGLSAVWRDGTQTLFEAWGVSAIRRGLVETLRVDLLRGGSPKLGADARALFAEFDHAEPVRRIKRLSVAGIDVALDLTLAAEATPAAGGGVPRVGNPSPSSVDTVAQADAQLTTLGELPALDRLRQLARRLRHEVRARWTPEAELEISELRLRLQRGAQRLNVGPGSVSATRAAEAFSLRFSPGGEATKETLQLELDLPLTSADMQLTLAGGPVSLKSLGIQEGDFGLASVEKALLAARAKIVVPDDERAVSLTADGSLRDWVVVQPRLAASAIAGPPLALQANVTLKDAGRTLAIDKASVSVGEAQLALSGHVRRAPVPELDLSFEIPLVSCQNLLASVPAAVAPLLEEMDVSGTFAVRGALQLDLARPEKIQATWDVKNDCQARAVPNAINPDQFRGVFEYYVQSLDNVPIARESGPGSADWTALEEISPHLETAVLVCEDGGFWRHKGFDEKAIHKALIENVKQGRFVRGASTISMQLAKNLYLGKEKTLARKFQEAVLTLLLEQTLSKREILELYLNVIEFGPEVYGVRAAAEHYFAREPRDLTLTQAFYLASILPNPKVSHLDSQGGLSKLWKGYLQRLLQIAHEIHRIGDIELELGLKEELEFAPQEARARGRQEPESETESVEPYLP